MTGWVPGPPRAPPRVLARTCSARAGVALLRGGPRGAPEPLEAHPSPSARPMCTPRGGGRSTRGVGAALARGDLAPGTGRRREGAHRTPLHAPHGAAGGHSPKPSTPTPDCERDAHAGWVRGIGAIRGSRPRTRGAHVKPERTDLRSTVLDHFTPLSRNLRHLRCRGGARGAAGPPRAAGGSVAVPGRSLGPHVVAWALAEGRRPHARVPTPRGPHPGAPSATEPWPPAGAPRRVGERGRGAQQPLLGP